MLTLTRRPHNEVDPHACWCGVVGVVIGEAFGLPLLRLSHSDEIDAYLGTVTVPPGTWPYCVCGRPIVVCLIDGRHG